MAGWNLKEGVCAKQNPSDQEFWNALEYLYSSTHKTTTYKFCFLKCLLDLNVERTALEFSFDDLFFRFAEIYWDLIVKYGLIQIYANSQYQKSKIEIIIENTISYHHLLGKNCAISDLSPQTRDNMLKEITRYCSQNVVGAFFESTHGLFYSFSKKERVLMLTLSSKSFLQRYDRLIEELNYFHWAKMLEKINGNNTPSSLVTKMSQLGNNTRLPPHQQSVLGVDKRFNLEDILPWSF